MKEFDVLAIVQKEVESAQKAYELAAQSFEQAQQRLLRAQATQQFLAKLMVEDEDGHLVFPREVIARVK